MRRTQRISVTIIINKVVILDMDITRKYSKDENDKKVLVIEAQEEEQN